MRFRKIEWEIERKGEMENRRNAEFSFCNPLLGGAWGG